MAACNIPTDYYSLWKCIGSRHPYPQGAFFCVCVCVCLPQRHDLDATDWIHAHWIGVRERGPPQIGSSMERRHALHFHRTLDDHWSICYFQNLNDRQDFSFFPAQFSVDSPYRWGRGSPIVRCLHVLSVSPSGPSLPVLPPDLMLEWSSSLTPPYPITSTSWSSDSELDEWSEDTVEVDDSEIDRRLCIASTWLDKSSNLRRRYLCSRLKFSFWAPCFRSFSSKFLIKCLALLRRPRVVCRELSAPTGTKSFNFSKHVRRCARRFFSNSLCVDLFPWGFLLFFVSLVFFVVNW